MSNLASFSVINEKVNKIYLEEDLENKGMAFSKLCLRIILKINDEELEESLTDGPMDGEIDAIYIYNRIINIFTFKFTDNFKCSKKNYPESELDQFILTVDNIISGNLDKSTINNAVWDKYLEILNLSHTGKVEFKIYIISNKLYPVDHAKKKLENVLDKYKIVEKPIYYNQDDLVLKIIENKKEKIDGNLKFIDTQHFEKSNGNIRTIIGAISAIDLIEIIKSKDKPDEINDSIFNENIRVYKPEHRVNKAIIDSANSTDNFLFFYLNNGITIFCEEVDYKPNTKAPFVPIKNLQIINGGQTSHSLFEVYKKNPDKINTIELLVRIFIAKKDDPISEKISETSNNQIPVGSRDLHSNDLIQQKLEEDFLTLGYFYERKPNQHENQPKGKILNNELLGQLFMAYFLDMPSEAKNSKVKVFGELYDDIFDEKIISANKLLKIYNIYLPILKMKKEIQKKKRKKEDIDEKEAFISRASFHIINGVKLLIDNEIIKINNSDLVQKEKNDKIESIYKKDISGIIENASSLIYEVVTEQMKIRGDQYTHDKFFKEIPTNNIIISHILKSLK